MKIRLNILVTVLAMLVFIPNVAFSDTQGKELFDTAVSAFSDEFYEASLPLFKRFIEDFPESQFINEAYYLRDLSYQGLAFGYLEQGKKFEAKVNINKIRNKELLLFSQSIYSLKSGSHMRALGIFNIFIKKYPDSKFLARALLNKANLLYEMGRLNDSSYVYRRILSTLKGAEYTNIIDKSHYGLAWCYLKSGKFKKAMDEFQNILKNTDNITVVLSSQIQLADTYQQSGSYDKALNIYNDILKHRPDTVYIDYVSFQAGMCFLKKNDFDKAIISFNDFTNKFVSSKLISKAKYYLALAYFSKKNYAQSKELVKKFTSESPYDELRAKAYYLWAKCFLNEGNYNEALKMLKKVLRQAGSKEIQEIVYVDIGNTYFNLSLFAQAKKTWRNFLEKYPSSQYKVQIALSLAGLYEKEAYNYKEMKVYRKAIAAFEQVLKLGLGSQKLRFSLALCKEKAKLGDEAIKEYSYLAGLGSGEYKTRAYFRIAKIYQKQGNKEAAKKIYNDIINSGVAEAKIARVRLEELEKE